MLLYTIIVYEYVYIMLLTILYYDKSNILYIKAGPTPVYVGWGSMTVYSKEHMARPAVKQTNQQYVNKQ